MQLAGSPSWRLEEKSSQAGELALFVRDALALPIASRADSASTVPPLSEAVPVLADVLAPHTRRGAGAQWPAWWSRIVEFEFRTSDDRPIPRDDMRRNAERELAEFRAVLDPPAFGSLAAQREFQAAARACFPAFRTWEAPRRHAPRDHEPQGSLPYALIRKVAEDVAFDRRVSPDAVRATVVTLPVRGTWWHRPFPGAVLCSPAAAADHRSAHALLRDAFDSAALRAPGAE